MATPLLHQGVLLLLAMAAAWTSGAAAFGLQQVSSADCAWTSPFNTVNATAIHLGNRKSCISGYGGRLDPYTMYQFCIPSWVAFTANATLFGEAAMNHAAVSHLRLQAPPRHQDAQRDRGERGGTGAVQIQHAAGKMRHPDGDGGRWRDGDPSRECRRHPHGRAEEDCRGVHRPRNHVRCRHCPRRLQRRTKELCHISCKSAWWLPWRMAPRSLTSRWLRPQRTALTRRGEKARPSSSSISAAAPAMLQSSGSMVVARPVSLPHAMMPAYLGGDDFTGRIVDYYFVELVKEKHHLDISRAEGALRKLRADCEIIKKALSDPERKSTLYNIGSLLNGDSIVERFTRAKFEELTRDLLTRAMEMVDQVVMGGAPASESQSCKDAIDEIILVGGSVRIPMVEQLLEGYFDGRGLIRDEEAMIRGAALLSRPESGKYVDECYYGGTADLLPGRSRYY